MQAETESGLLGPLEEWLDRIARPIEFATRDDGAHLKAVTNLSDFISTQVLSALRQQPYPKAIEARLISLRDLFVDFPSSLSLDEQRRRLRTAGRIKLFERPRSGLRLLRRCRRDLFLNPHRLMEDEPSSGGFLSDSLRELDRSAPRFYNDYASKRSKMSSGASLGGTRIDRS